MGKPAPSVLAMSPKTTVTATMAAAVIRGPRTIEVRSVAVPEPGSGQVRVKLEGCGVFPMQELLTHRYSLGDLPLAMRDMEERPEGFLKGWVCYD